jgi:hypothetical protein
MSELMVVELQDLVENNRASIQHHLDFVLKRRLDASERLVILIRGDSPLAVCVPQETRDSGASGSSCGLVKRSDIAAIVRQFAPDSADEVEKPSPDGKLWILVSTKECGSLVPIAAIGIAASN